MSNSASKEALSSGPFHLPRFTSFPNNLNNRLTISIKNPTDRHLKALVRLDICRNPTTPTSGTFPLTPDEFIVGTTQEDEYNFGLVKVDPHSCKRIERFIDPTELRSTFRVFTLGDYAVYKGKPVGGLLEISVVAGFTDTPSTFGLRQADASTSIPYESWVVARS